MEQFENAEYSEVSFWKKVMRVTKKAGQEVIEKALMLYYAAQNPEMPSWARKTVYGALAYFILPLDAVPDILPGVGFVDDLGALAAAIATVMMYITPEVRDKAKEKVAELFGKALEEMER